MNFRHLLSCDTIANFNLKKKLKSLCCSPYNGQHEVLLHHISIKKLAICDS